MTPEEQQRKVRLLRTVLKVMTVLAAFGGTAAFAERANNPVVTCGFYAAVFGAIFVLHLAVKRGAIQTAAWGVGLFLWVMVAFVTLYFGGM